MNKSEIDAAMVRIEKNQKPIAGIARILQDYLTELGLKAIPEESEYKWHADVIGWPEKHTGKASLIAIKLAEKIGRVDLVTRP